MALAINTTLRGNISRLTKDRLREITDTLDEDDVLEKSTLVLLGTELAAHNKIVMEQVNIERLLEMLEHNIPVKTVKEIQNVFLDYAERALKGKQEGGKRRKTRRVRKHKRKTYRRRSYS